MAEIIFASGDGFLRVLKGTEKLLEKNFRNPVFTPSISDIDGDGKFEAVVGVTPNSTYILKLPSGEVLASYRGIAGDRPAIGDIDGDNKPEIIIGAANGSLVVLKYEDDQLRLLGSLRYPGSSVYPPIVYDINNDGLNEILVGVRGIGVIALRYVSP